MCILINYICYILNIDGPIEQFGVAKAVVCAIMSVGWCI